MKTSRKRIESTPLPQKPSDSLHVGTSPNDFSGFPTSEKWCGNCGFFEGTAVNVRAGVCHALPGAVRVVETWWCGLWRVKA